MLTADEQLQAACKDLLAQSALKLYGKNTFVVLSGYFLLEVLLHAIFTFIHCLILSVVLNFDNLMFRGGVEGWVDDGDEAVWEELV